MFGQSPAAFIVAFLVAISRFDIEMLLWGRLPKRHNSAVDSLNFLFVPSKRPIFYIAFFGFNLYFGRLNISNAFVERSHLRRCNSRYCSLCAGFS